MIALDALAAARSAVAANATRPATAIVHDSADVRLIVFRLAPGQCVAPHRSTSTVMLQVLAGQGQLTGEVNGGVDARAVRAGDVMMYAPSELHGMTATDDEMLLLATITPRPGGR